VGYPRRAFKKEMTPNTGIAPRCYKESSWLDKLSKLIPRGKAIHHLEGYIIFTPDGKLGKKGTDERCISDIVIVRLVQLAHE